MAEIISLIGLFAAAFGAATVLPFQSEIVFVALQTEGSIPLFWIVSVASIGNILGSCVNYILGLWLEHYKSRRWFPVTGRQLKRAQHWYGRYGIWTLLLSWAPFGDAFTVVAGVMRTPLWIFVALVSIAKIGRYAALAWATARLVEG